MYLTSLPSFQQEKLLRLIESAFDSAQSDQNKQRALYCYFYLKIFLTIGIRVF